MYWNIFLGRLLVKHVTDRHLYRGHACMYIPVCQYRPWLHDDSCAPSVVHVHKIKRTYAPLNISQFPSGRDMYGNVMKNNVYLYSYLCSSNDDVLLCYYYYYICSQHICTYIYRKENHFNLEQTFTFFNTHSRTSFCISIGKQDKVKHQISNIDKFTLVFLKETSDAIIS